MIKYLSIHMAKNILRKQFGPMYGKNKPYALSEPLPVEIKQEPMKIQSPVSLTTLILFTILVVFFMLLYLNRSYFYDIVQRMYKDFQPSTELDQLEKKYQELSQAHSKLLETTKPEKPVLDTIEKKEKDQQKNEMNQESGGVKKIEHGINRYSDEQKVKKNGFCYIGYDKNQRECTNVFEGDICMSGQVFPTMAVCLNPHLRP
jgi:hypothetical protein